MRCSTSKTSRPTGCRRRPRARARCGRLLGLELGGVRPASCSRHGDAVDQVFDRLLAPARREANRAAELAAAARQGVDPRRRQGDGGNGAATATAPARPWRARRGGCDDPRRRCARRIDALRDSRRYRLASNDTRDRIERLIVKSVALGPADAEDARLATWIGRLCDFLEAIAGRPAYLTLLDEHPSGLRAPVAHHLAGEVGRRLPADASGGARRTARRPAAGAVRHRALGRHLREQLAATTLSGLPGMPTTPTRPTSSARWMPCARRIMPAVFRLLAQDLKAS